MNFLHRIFVLLLLSSLFYACAEHAPMEDTATQETAESSNISLSNKQFEASKFELGKVEQRKFKKSLQVVGSIHIPEKSKATVSSFMNGTVGPINLIEGQYVVKGQKLFTITNPELINIQEEYLIAKGKLSYLQEENKRQEELAEAQISTKKDLLKVQTELHTTATRYNALKKKLNLFGIHADRLSPENLISAITISAPISGNISEINTNRGTYLNAGIPAMKIVSQSHLHLELSVLEKYASELKKGQPVVFSLQSNPSETYMASIHLTNKMIDESHMITVHCHIDESAKKDLIPGMYTNATIELAEYSSMALPQDAAVQSGEKWYVLVLKKEIATERIFEEMEVQVGSIQNGYIELMNDDRLKDQQILTIGAYYLL